MLVATILSLTAVACGDGGPGPSANGELDGGAGAEAPDGDSASRTPSTRDGSNGPGDSEPRGSAQGCEAGAMWGNTYRELYHVQPTETGYEVKLVGSFGLEPDEEMFDIAYTPDGNLYGLSQPSSGTPTWSLNRIDPETGAATHVFSAAPRETFAWGLASRPNGELYMLNVAGAVFRIDPSDSEKRVLVTQFHQDYLTGADMAFTDDATMYVAVSTDGIQTYDTVLRYDFGDGTMTDLGPLPIEGRSTVGLSMDGLAARAGKLIGFGSGLLITIDLTGYQGKVTYPLEGMPSFVGATEARCR